MWGAFIVLLLIGLAACDSGEIIVPRERVIRMSHKISSDVRCVQQDDGRFACTTDGFFWGQKFVLPRENSYEYVHDHRALVCSDEDWCWIVGNESAISEMIDTFVPHPETSISLFFLSCFLASVVACFWLFLKITIFLFQLVRETPVSKLCIRSEKRVQFANTLCRTRKISRMLPTQNRPQRQTKKINRILKMSETGGYNNPQIENENKKWNLSTTDVAACMGIFGILCFIVGLMTVENWPPDRLIRRDSLFTSPTRLVFTSPTISTNNRDVFAAPVTCGRYDETTWDCSNGKWSSDRIRMFNPTETVDQSRYIRCFMNTMTQVIHETCRLYVMDPPKEVKLRGPLVVHGLVDGLWQFADHIEHGFDSFFMSFLVLFVTCLYGLVTSAVALYQLVWYVPSILLVYFMWLYYRPRVDLSCFREFGRRVASVAIRIPF